jgi:hypothetical protein
MYLQSQVNIYNLSLTDSSLNYLYVGVENEIKTNGMTPHHAISITGKGSTITLMRQNHYIVRVAVPTDECKVTITKANKQIFQKIYKIRMLSNPIATINGLRDTTMKASILMVNPFLVAHIPGSYYHVNYSVTSFRATFINSIDSTLTTSTGNNLSAEQLKLVRSLESGDKIYFDGIRATCPDCRSVTLPAFWIRIE